jgi:DNA mismatch repair ATPase MutS
MKQYNSIKAKYPDALLLFRVGDFYETFSEDAVKAARILDIVLTKRGAGSTTETALAGFPHHSINTYLPKLVKAGLRVAICDQLEDPKLTKKIVKRGVTELVTPGVSLNDEVLQSKSNNFLGVVHYGKKKLGVAFLDVSTGEFLTAQGDIDYIDKLLHNFQPNEVIVQKQFKKDFTTDFGDAFYTYFMEDWVFQSDFAREVLTKHFHVNSLKGYGIDKLNEDSKIGLYQYDIVTNSLNYQIFFTDNESFDVFTQFKSADSIFDESIKELKLKGTISKMKNLGVGNINLVIKSEDSGKVIETKSLSLLKGKVTTPSLTTLSTS